MFIFRHASYWLFCLIWVCCWMLCLELSNETDKNGIMLFNFVNYSTSKYSAERLQLIAYALNFIWALCLGGFKVLSTRATLGNLWETGWNAYGLFEAHRYRLELIRTVSKVKWISNWILTHWKPQRIICRKQMGYVAGWRLRGFLFLHYIITI